MIATAKLPLLFDPERLHADLAKIAQEDWVAHFNKNDYEGDWRVVPLRSVGGRARHIYSDPAVKPTGFAPTPILQQCPYFQGLLAAFECPQSSARLMSLGAGSRISEHRDHTIDFEEGRARLHIPIVTSPAVEFYLAGERIVMNEGETWYLDFSEPHSVYNAGRADRIHLVLDCVVNDWLRSLIDAGRSNREVSFSNVPPSVRT
jgi:quercetin dioxygenase-like cupin family protein